MTFGAKSLNKADVKPNDMVRTIWLFTVFITVFITLSHFLQAALPANPMLGIFENDMQFS